MGFFFIFDPKPRVGYSVRERRRRSQWRLVWWTVIGIIVALATRIHGG